MTRSARSVPTYRQAKKAFKQSAIDAGISHKPEIYALWNKAVADSEKNKARKPPLVSARNPRRMDGNRWNGSSFVCPARVEDDSADGNTIDKSSAADRSEQKNENGEQAVVAPSRIVCLLDLARPAKPKGIRKEFEVVDNLPGVIVLEDEDGTWGYGDWVFSDDNWEEILVDSPTGAAVKSFAEVLRGGG